MHFVVLVSDSEDEPMTRGIPYNFAVLNSPVTGHLGKRIINPKWWNQFWWKLWCWIWDMRGYLSEKFQTYRISNFGYIIEIVTGISAEEIRKLGLPVPTLFREFPFTIFRKGVHWTAPFEEIYLFIQSYLKDSKFWKLGFLQQTLDQQTPGQGRTPQIGNISHGSDDWLIDSGVSKHMIGFKESFVRLSEHESPHKVKLGDEAKALHKEITSDLDRYDSSRYVLRFVHD